MKKIFSVLMMLIILICTVPAAAAAFTPGKYIVTKNVARVYSSPSITSEKIAELTKNTVLDITEIRNDAFGRAYIAKDGVYGWIQLEALEKTAEYEADENVTGIEITLPPAKLIYTDGKEELDLTGLRVSAVCRDGSRRLISAYSVYAPEMKGPGQKTVKVTYCPDGLNIYSAEFTVTVIRDSIKKISVVGMPETQYLEHEKLDLSGLKIFAEFENESENLTLSYSELAANPDFTVTGCHGETDGSVLSKGQHTFTVSYKYTDISCSFTVDVTPRKLISLTVKQLPDSLTVYDNTKPPAIDGLILEAVYDNGEIEDVYHYDCTVVCDPSAFIIGPGNRVDVYFGELFVTLNYRYSVAVPAKIVIEYPNDQNGNLFPFSYLKGEPVDLSGIKVRLVYTDDSYVYVTDYRITSVNYSVTGAQNISVTYGEFSEVFTINISPYYSKGDITGDGKIMANDARQALRAAVGLTTLSGMTFFAGDADRNGEITSADARLILRASVGLENLYLTL